MSCVVEKEQKFQVERSSIPDIHLLGKYIMEKVLQSRWGSKYTRRCTLPVSVYYYSTWNSTWRISEVYACRVFVISSLVGNKYVISFGPVDANYSHHVLLGQSADLTFFSLTHVVENPIMDWNEEFPISHQDLKLKAKIGEGTFNLKYQRQLLFIYLISISFISVYPDSPRYLYNIFILNTCLSI